MAEQNDALNRAANEAYIFLFDNGTASLYTNAPVGVDNAPTGTLLITFDLPKFSARNEASVEMETGETHVPLLVKANAVGDGEMRSYRMVSRDGRLVREGTAGTVADGAEFHFPHSYVGQGMALSIESATFLPPL